MLDSLCLQKALKSFTNRKVGKTCLVLLHVFPWKKFNYYFYYFNATGSSRQASQSEPVADADAPNIQNSQLLRERKIVRRGPSPVTFDSFPRRYGQWVMGRSKMAKHRTLP